MSPEGGHGERWQRLVAERAALRAELGRALERFDARMRDPLRFKETIRRHPLVAAGVAAGAGALLVRALLPGGEREPEIRVRPSAAAAPSLFDELRDTALRAAVPMVVQFVQEQLGGGTEPSDAPDAAGRANGAAVNPAPP